MQTFRNGAPPREVLLGASVAQAVPGETSRQVPAVRQQ